jgi:predicted RNA-binding protein with PUA-like domain
VTTHGDRIRISTGFAGFAVYEMGRIVMAGRYWLVKTEADCFSIHDLAAAPGKTTAWSGVRNYQARNFMRDEMKLGDRVLFYHSNDEPSAIVGTAVVARESYPDATAFDPADDHYDPKASPDNPIWQLVDIRLESIFERPLSLALLREAPGLERMELLRKGSRLSVQPVTPAEFAIVLRLAKAGAPAASANSPAGKAATFRRATAKARAAGPSAGKKKPVNNNRRPASAR